MYLDEYSKNMLPVQDLVKDLMPIHLLHTIVFDWPNYMYLCHIPCQYGWFLMWPGPEKKKIDVIADNNDFANDNQFSHVPSHIIHDNRPKSENVVMLDPQW